MNRIVFWGATGQAKVLLEALPVNAFHLVALFDNRDIPSPFDGIPIFKGEAGFAEWQRSQKHHRDTRACVAIGGSRGKDRLNRMLWLEQRGYSPLTVVHPRAFVSTSAYVDSGCQILALSAVCASAKLGKAVIVNTRASVDHDCVIGSGAHIAPGATLAGEVIVGECTLIGAGAIILPRIRIGANATVGAGAVVTRDVPAGATVIGNPARPHRKQKR